MRALNATVKADNRNPYRELELDRFHRYPDIEAARRDFYLMLPLLGRPVEGAELNGLWALYLRGRHDEWRAAQAVRAAEERAAIDGVETAGGVVYAEVTSAVPDAPAMVGRRA